MKPERRPAEGSDGRGGALGSDEGANSARDRGGSWCRATDIGPLDRPRPGPSGKGSVRVGAARHGGAVEAIARGERGARQGAVEAAVQADPRQAARLAHRHDHGHPGVAAAVCSAGRTGRKPAACIGGLHWRLATGRRLSGRAEGHPSPLVIDALATGWPRPGHCARRLRRARQDRNPVAIAARNRQAGRCAAMMGCIAAGPCHDPVARRRAADPSGLSAACYALRKAVRSAFTWSLCVQHRPCPASG